MSRVEQPLVREAVEVTPRRAMTYGEKHRRWNECGGVCAICKKTCSPAGHDVIWDHRVAIALGGTNDLANMEPNHAGICAAAKTARDIKAIAKARRIRKRDAGLAPKKRGFSKPEGMRYDWARGRYVREG